MRPRVGHELPDRAGRAVAGRDAAGEHVAPVAIAGAAIAVTGAWLMQRARIGAIDGLTGGPVAPGRDGR